MRATRPTFGMPRHGWRRQARALDGVPRGASTGRVSHVGNRQGGRTTVLADIDEAHAAGMWAVRRRQARQ